MSFARTLEKKRREIAFSQSFLKIVGMFTMLIDHISLTLIINGKLYGYDATLYRNAIMIPEASGYLILNKILRMIGRIAFPIFAFLIVEGFRKTNNLFKYMLRILVFALLSEIPYNLMVFNKVFCFSTQNVLFTYFIGLLMLIFVKLVSEFSGIISVIIAVVALLICKILHTDYAIEGIILIYIFYIFRNDINLKSLIAIIVLFISSIEKYYGAACLSVFFIYFYDGTKGYLDLKKFPYFFFPLHMIILYGIVFFSYIGK